ncbi:MAG: VanZ family protein [Flavobacteriaceae bacterium]
MLKKSLPLLAFTYTIALAVISLLNSSKLPSIDVNNSDKFAHAIAYGLLCFVWYMTLKAHKFSSALLIAVFVAVIYGIILEILQGTLTEARVPDVYDILANCIGVAFISIFITIRNKSHVKNL